MKNSKKARANGLKQLELTMKMFQVKVHNLHNETLHFPHGYHNICLPCHASDTYHNSYHKQSIGFRPD